MCHNPFNYRRMHASLLLTCVISMRINSGRVFAFQCANRPESHCAAQMNGSNISIHNRNLVSLSATRSTSRTQQLPAYELDPRISKRVREIIERFDLTPNKRDMFWLSRYVELEQYKEVNGDCLVPQKYPENQQLGAWVRNQRTHYRYLVQDDNPHREETKQESNMKEWRFTLFEEIGFEWEVVGWYDVWEQSFAELVEYKDEHGDCNVPQDYKKKSKLGFWVNTQRAKYWLRQEGKESDMTEERIKKLEGIGFEWTVQVPWEDRFEELKEFKKRFKNCNVPQLWKGSRELSYWVNTQRKQYRLLQEGKESSMTKERIELLESIDFQWTVQVPWEDRFEELKEFKKRFNHCNVPQHSEENYQLGQWVHNQRKQYRLMHKGEPSTMTIERIELLESIGFQWSLRKD